MNKIIIGFIGIAVVSFGLTFGAIHAVHSADAMLNRTMHTNLHHPHWNPTIPYNGSNLAIESDVISIAPVVIAVRSTQHYSGTTWAQTNHMPEPTAQPEGQLVCGEYKESAYGGKYRFCKYVD